MADFFEIIYAQAESALEPVTQAAQSDWGLTQLLGMLGFDLDAVTGLDLSALRTALNELVAALDALQSLSGPQAISDIEAAAQAIASVIDSVRKLLASLQQQAGLPAGLGAQLGAAGEQLLQALLARWVTDLHPAAYQVLNTLGVIDTAAQNGAPILAPGGGVAYLPVPVSQINTSTLLGLFRDPAGTLSKQVFGGPAPTGQAEINALTAWLWPRLAAFFGTVNRTALPGNDPGYRAATGDLGAAGDALANASLVFPIVSDDTGDQVLVALTLIPASAPGGKTVIVLTVDGKATQTITDGPLQVTLTAAGAAQALAVDTAGNVTLPSSAAASDSLTLTMALSYAPPGAVDDDPGSDDQVSPLLIGSANGTRIEVSQVTLTGTAAFAAATPATVGIELTVSGVNVVLDFSDGDGFLQTVAGQVLGGPVSAKADVTVGWAHGRGVYLKAAGSLGNAGASGLKATVPADLDLGPVRIPDITIGVAPVQAAAGEQVTLTAGLDATVSIGPVSAAVTNLGLHALLDSTPGGNLGALNLTLRFKPPDGIAASIDADPVSGGGFIAFDEADARYLGALGLSVGDISIGAVGVLDTRLPGGTKGYSLVVVAAATFPPVQLGFGFSLDGLGLLIGVHRTMDVPSLQAIARAGHLDDLMFPTDLAERAPQVAANLAAEFPAAQGHFVIGPALQLQWGADGLVDIEVGVLIELSDAGGGISLLRVALLGFVHLTLPEADAPVADLTLDVLGVVDLAAKTLSLDAGLRNSTVAGFPLTGQAAVRAGWGSNPEFVCAIGGFAPGFAAPAGFPALQRVTMSIGDNDAQLLLSAYLALTSNTLQFGCAASLSATAGPAAVKASLSFDALIQFKPFGLTIDLTITASVLLDGDAIMSLDLDLHLKGPRPWTVTGRASFHVLFCGFSVPIAITVGPQPPPAPAVLVDLTGNLTTALADPRSWQISPPPGQGVVRVRELGAARPAVHPLGSLTVRQHAVPLQQRVDRSGADLLQAPCQYQVSGAALAGQALPAADVTAVTDFFAPAQFITMTDAKKLSAPSFEAMDSGVTLGSTAVTVAQTPGAGGTSTVTATSATAQWDMLVLDSPDPAQAQAPAPAPAPALAANPDPAPAGPVTLPAALLAAQLSGAASAVNGPGGRGSAAYAGQANTSGITIQQPTYAVTGMNLAYPSVADGAPAGLAADRPGLVPDGPGLFRIPTAAAAGSAGLSGAAGQQWQVVYHSEVAGTWAT
jgi:hypothetical protein